MGQHLDEQIRAGAVPRAVIVVPRGDFGFWENWADGSFSYRDWVIRGLVPEVASRYHTRPCPDGCHLVGISMGGHGALRFAVLDPGRFRSVAVISGPILDTDAALDLMQNGLLSWFIPSDRIWGTEDPEEMRRDDVFQRWTGPEDVGDLRLMLAWGDGDHEQIVRTNERFARHLTESSIEHEAFVFPGRHNWKAWIPALERVLATQLKESGP